MGTQVSAYVLLICLIGFFSFVTDAKFYKFENCGPQSTIQVKRFDVRPDPVKMNKNATVNTDLTVLRTIPNDTVISSKIYKIKKILGVSIPVYIPCVFGKFGSCSTNICTYLEESRPQLEPLYPKDQKYGCPVQPGFYGGANLVVQPPDYGAVAKIFAAGQYRVEIEAHSNGKLIACYKVHAEMRA